MREDRMDERHFHGDGISDVGASAIMRGNDAWGKPLLRIGDIVATLTFESDPGTVVKIIQNNANGAHYVAVKWFTWDNGRTTEEHVKELELVSET